MSVRRHSEVPTAKRRLNTSGRSRLNQPTVKSPNVNPLLAGLTDAQRQVVEHLDGPLLVLAGPGSGKTRVVTHRIANLLQHGVAPSQIVALTFTNKAADEMRARIARLGALDGVWVSTFHRFGARLLRQYAAQVGLAENFTIYDMEDSLAALKRALDGAEFDGGRFTPDQIQRTISRIKNSGGVPEEIDIRRAQPLEQVALTALPAYQHLLLKSNAVDFDDLLLHLAKLLADFPDIRAELDHRLRYVLVDEYQDTNRVQYDIVRALSQDFPNLAVTGDPDQSIYGWRGANIENILCFEGDFPEVRVVRLEQNYRSTPEILRAASSLICHNHRRKHKELFTEKQSGRPVRVTLSVDHAAEANHIADYVIQEVRAGRRRARDFAVFYRMTALTRSIEEAFRQRGVPFQVLSGLEFYQRKEVKDVLAYLQLLNNPRDDQAFLRVINAPPRGLGKTTLQRLMGHADRSGTPLLEAARQCGLIDGIDNRKAVAIARFVAMIDELSVLVTRSVREIVTRLLSASGYLDHLKETESSDGPDRYANVQELITAADEYDMQHPHDGSLEGFLEQCSLVNEVDAWDEHTDCVTLMTLHAAKGLEFPVVFIVAVESGILPHDRSKESEAQFEEERRLLFVGMTRAQEELHLSLAMRRNFRGLVATAIPSEFLLELPRDELVWQRPDGHQALSDTSLEAPRRPRRPRRPPTSTPQATLVTGLQLAAGKKTPPRLPPEAFYTGQRVVHPEYGLGRVEEIGDSDFLKHATVHFDSAVGTKRFVLAHCSLQPADESDLPDEFPES